MFAKLVKHEFKASGRLIPFVYLAAIVLIAGNLLLNSQDIGWLKGLLIFLLVVNGIAMVVLTYVVVFFRYYRTFV